MVAIHPFYGLRYDPAQAGELSAVLAPPYDVIDSDEQERLYTCSAYNVVRLILGKQFPADTASDNRYTRTRRDFDAWKVSGVLAFDPQPAIYLIQQLFSGPHGPVSRLGFIALLGLDDNTRQQVFRHEMTLSAPKADRTRLLEAVPANLEPIFCVYPDAQASLQAQLTAITQGQPDGDAQLNEERVKMWVVRSPDLIKPIQQHLAKTAVLIADGHHRFEVGFANRVKFPAVMTYFASMRDPGLVVMPIHRLVSHASAMDWDKLAQVCEVKPQAEAACLEWLGKTPQPGRFVVLSAGQWRCVSVREERLARWLMSPTVDSAVASLDVSLLHGLILPFLGQADAAYHADFGKAAAFAREGANRSAWFLRGIPLEQVYAIAAAGITLSPKSTYFYPKVPSGLVINAFDHQEASLAGSQ